MARAAQGDRGQAFTIHYGDSLQMVDIVSSGRHVRDG